MRSSQACLLKYRLMYQVQWLKAVFTTQCFPETQKNFSAQESRSSLAGSIQEALGEHYSLQEVHQCLI